MKRIYIISGALILLAIITADLYISDTRKLNSDKNADGTSASLNAQPAAPQGNAAVTMPATSSATTSDHSSKSKTISPVAKINHKHLRNNTEAIAVNANYELNAAPKQTAAPIENAPVVALHVEKAKDYYGMKPKETAKKHKRITLPEGLGLEIGYNQSSLQNNQTANTPIGNVNVGLLMNFDLGEHLSFQPGVRYITRGNRLMSNNDIAVQEKLSLHYLELPANIELKIGKVGNARLIAGGGPYVAYLVSAKDRFMSGATDDNDRPLPPQYSTGNFNKFDWGMGGFIGCQSPDGLFLKATAETGMMDIMKSADGKTSNRNSSFMVTFGYILGGH